MCIQHIRACCCCGSSKKKPLSELPPYKTDECNDVSATDHTTTYKRTRLSSDYCEQCEPSREKHKAREREKKLRKKENENDEKERQERKVAQEYMRRRDKKAAEQYEAANRIHMKDNIWGTIGGRAVEDPQKDARQREWRDNLWGTKDGKPTHQSTEAPAATAAPQLRTTFEHSAGTFYEHTSYNTEGQRAAQQEQVRRPEGRSGERRQREQERGRREEQERRRQEERVEEQHQLQERWAEEKMRRTQDAAHQSRREEAEGRSRWAERSVLRQAPEDIGRSEAQKRPASQSPPEKGRWPGPPKPPSPSGGRGSHKGRKA